MKRVLITGANSYVGTNVEKWLMKEPENYYIETLDMKNPDWKEYDFSKFDVVFHVAAIVHEKSNSKNKDMYYIVNTDLAISVGEIAKKAGIKQFIFMSTMAVYGEDGLVGKVLIIDVNTPTNPKTTYAKSKLKAEISLNNMSDKGFKVVIIRPPMIYGPKCKGNYAKLELLAKKLPVFPYIENQRSMLNIDYFCVNVKCYIDFEKHGLFLPQDIMYSNTSLLVKELAEKNDTKIHLSKILGVFIRVFFKRFKIVKKIFGNLTYKNNLQGDFYEK
jgi:UDP-glucose 4-epimerase